MRGLEPPTPGSTSKANDQAFEPAFPDFSRILASEIGCAIHLTQGHFSSKNRGIQRDEHNAKR